MLKMAMYSDICTHIELKKDQIFIEHCIICVSEIMNTCYVIDRVKPNTKTPNFQRIFSLVTFHEIANAFPIIFFKDGIVMTIKSWALKLSKIWVF